MSFIELATLALHRRNEMEEKIKVFTSKCDKAIKNIEKLKFQAQSLVHQLNCEPSELKERFLNCTLTLEEYTYVITDFNLMIEKLEETKSSIEYAPVHDTSSKTILTPTQAINIMDMLSEATPSTSHACRNFCPMDHKPKKFPKEEQTLIAFSSTSSSSESMPMKREVNKKEQEVQCQLAKGVQEISLKDETSPLETIPTLAELSNLPAQTVLETDHIYPATIMNVDGSSLWVITDDPDEAYQLMTEMTSYYKENSTAELSIEEISNLTYCAFYDDDSDCYYRALFIRLLEPSTAEVFLVDTGEVRTGSRAALRPLQPAHAARAPYARCCHLAGVDLVTYNKDLAEEQERYLRRYVGTQCSIEVDDNTSESLGVYVMLSETDTLNELLVSEGLALSSEKAVSSAPVEAPSKACAELAALDQIDMAAGPEYEDPVEAVTGGYSCRDEMDICKHYKGGPEKTCFKGARCKKRHVLMHPDGWTLDRVEVCGKCPPLPLPAPGTWHRAAVTCVAHFDRVYVQLRPDAPSEEETLPEFGVILPAANIDQLVRDMNSPASKMAFKPLKIMPAVGELVAALFPPDDQWYRARVLSVTRADQTVEVQYIDYGNVGYVREDALRVLEARYTALPAQALRCSLAGVVARAQDSRLWAAAKAHLQRLVLDRTMHMHVVARGYDDVTVELLDEHGYSVAEKLAALDMVTLVDYPAGDDAATGPQVVVP